MCLAVGEVPGSFGNGAFMESGAIIAGRYRLDESLGQGGMGQVWRGFDLREETAVAIKLMLSAKAGPDLLDRFKREAVLASSLRSPRILPVYDAGQYGEQFYIVMKLLEGRDLGKIMDDGNRATGLPIDRAVDLAIQLAGGLAAVHEKGIIHRDLKPDNLFIELREIRDELRGRGGVTAPLAVGSRSLRHLGAFLLDGSGSLRYHEYWPEPGWEKMDSMSLPAGQVTAVASGSHDDNHLEVAVAVGGAVYNKSCWQDPEGSHWAEDWEDQGAIGSPVRDLAISSVVPGHMELFALGADGRLRHRRWGAEWFNDRGWSEGWTDMPGPSDAPVSAIAMCSEANHHQKIFAIVDGTVWHRWWWRTSGWSRWGQRSGIPARAVDVACSSLTRTHSEVFALDDAGRIWHRWYWPGKWSKWQELAGPASAAKVTAIASGAHSDREQDLVALTTDGKLYHSYHWLGNGDWTKWEEMPR